MVSTGILQLRPAHLDHPCKPLLCPLKRFLQRHEAFFQSLEGEDGGQLQRGRIRVVRGLVPVEVFQRRNALVSAVLQAEQFQGPVGQHLVDIHVGAGSRPALQEIRDDVRREDPLA